MLITLFFVFFLLGILTRSTVSMEYARQGLTIWFQSMIPALLPFMILSGILVRMDLTRNVSCWSAPLLKRIFRCSEEACYCMIIGFLCGFPMGARTISELLERGRIDKTESRLLLFFCNNIGPAYLAGIAIPYLHVKYPAYFFACFYGIPFLYGILLFRRSKTFSDQGPKSSGSRHKKHGLKELLISMENSVTNAMASILTLGGYVIIFCLLNLLPHWLTGASKPFLGPLFEITSGIHNLHGQMPLYCMTMLSFGGLCCLAQTYAAIKNTALSECIGEYALHKAFQAVLTLLTFCVLRMVLPDFFGA